MADKKPKFLPKIESPNSSVIGSTNFAISGSNPFENDETPIFSKHKILLRIPNNYTGNFTHLTVSKNWLICILNTLENSKVLLRFFLPRVIPPGEIILDKYLTGYKITKLFLDPTGHHLLISLVPESQGLSADFLYIHGNGPKVRRIEKFKDHEITAVAFNTELGTEATTGPILLGTSRGLIFETELMQDADKPAYRKQLYDLGLGRIKYPITGLELIYQPIGNKSIVIASAIDSLYTFQDTPKPDDKLLQTIFSRYVNGSQEPIVEEQKTMLNYSILKFYAATNETYPQQWAWLCGIGIRVGEVTKDPSSSAILLGDSLINLDFQQHTHRSIDERRLSLPKAFVLTEYHALLMYADHISGICLLNQQLVYEEYFHEQMGKLLNIVRDASTGVIYVYTQKTIFKYKIIDEHRNIWRIFLDKGLYDLAEQHAADVPEHLNVVLRKRADLAFIAADYQTAANIYADTQNSFEEVCLKLMTLEDKRPIISYVRKRLSKLHDCDDNAERIKVLVLWLVDLYIIQINLPEQSSKCRAQWQAEYDEFMGDPKVVNCTQKNRTLVQQLITQQADAHNLAQFAVSNGDYEEVINQQLNAEKYMEALETLRKQNQPELFYKHAPILIEHLPQETVEILIAQGHKLQVDKLVPTLIVINSPKHVEQIIKYLEHSIYNLGATSQAIHNYLLRLYAEHKPTMLISYLENEGRDETLVHYDINYALNVCTEFNVKVACVFLQCLLQMWPTAVELALTFDLRLAKETASKPSDEELRRKLWLRIAHHDIQGTNDVKKALNLLKECKLLHIEDLLPFFSDFEKIDNFKDAICQALKDYNQKIVELQHDMAECSKQAARVRNDVQNLRQRSIRINSHELCSICETFLLLKPFFAFICGHKFHHDCLEKQVMPMLTTERSRRLTTLKQQLEILMTAQTLSTIEQQAQPVQQKKRIELKEQIEEILASDCLYCGLLIDTIDQPFIEDWDQVHVDWE